MRKESITESMMIVQKLAEWYPACNLLQPDPG